MLHALLMLAAAAEPATGPPARAAPRVEVSATRLREAEPFELPLSLTRIELAVPARRPGMRLSDALAGVPGVAARERQNLAQDAQVSIRGFGARATFGVRGLRLYVDGIPATMPDGQGQVSHVHLAAADRVEVLRGPFSALHGNASGGAIEVWSADGGDAEAQASLGAGADAAQAASARWRGTTAGGSARFALTHFETGGFRDHSAARRTLLDAGWRRTPWDGADLSLSLHGFDAPGARDPLGLSRAQADADPRQATDAAYRFDTRKSARQAQLGVRLSQRLDAARTLRVAAWGGQRRIEQFLAVPVAAQANPLHSGGVVDLDSRSHGLDARWTWQGALRDREAEVALGLALEAQAQQRRGFENFQGERLGVRGALRRDERNRVASEAAYAQAWWRLAPRWSLLAGARASTVRFRADDDFVTSANPDDSGRVRYRALTPVAGLSFAPRPDLRLYASYGEGFETPTFNELGYRADGAAGLAFDLRPARSRHAEFGTRWRGANGATVEAAWFHADTRDELAVARNVGGRSSFRNVGRARRAGFELGAQWPLGEDLALQLAYTRLQARFRDAFPVCAGSGCVDPSLRVPAGTRVPGTARDQFHARLAWERAAWRLDLEAELRGPVTVNDIGSERAPGHALLHLEIARELARPQGDWRAFLRLDNVLDARAIGSVIVNESNARYHEPYPGRGLWLGLQWVWRP